MIQSFKIGEKFYKIKNTFSQKSKSIINATIGRWEFNAKIMVQNNEYKF